MVINNTPQRSSALKPDFRTLGMFHPKELPGTKVMVKIRLDDGSLNLSYDRNGSLSGIDPDSRAKLEDQLALLEGQRLHDALTTHRLLGPIHITDADMLATIIYRGKTLDLRTFGIRVSAEVQQKTVKKLTEFEHPTDIILGKNQVVKT